MCGIAGAYDPFGASDPRVLAETVREIAGGLKHRGPDDASFWGNEVDGVHLGHRRLAVVDPSASGRQPMEDESGVVVFNGEIYNHRSLRGELKGPWRGHSDTETLMAAIREWGLDGALKRLEGMFAFAYWSKRERALYLARDRFGEKPIYYATRSGRFCFASELMPLVRGLEGLGFTDVRKVSHESLNLFLRKQCIGGSGTIFDSIFKLLPASVARVSANGHEVEIRQDRYWNAADVAADSVRMPYSSEEEACEVIDGVLEEAVLSRLESDVPLGVFLSGGIDSSLITAIVQRNTSDCVKTFTASFEDEKFNEGEIAREVAEHLGTEHHDLRISERHLIDCVEEMPRVYDEPFSDASQVPTYLISKLTRQSVTVCLSGDGGDEIFGGYNRHVWGERLSRVMSRSPAGLRRWTGRVGGRLSMKFLRPLLSKAGLGERVANLEDKWYRVMRMLESDSGMDFYDAITDLWRESDGVATWPWESGKLYDPESLFGSLTDKLMLIDTLTYLPDDVLAKVDRASMANSLETRAPFLDRGLFSAAWRMNRGMKVSGEGGKRYLRKYLARLLPENIVSRPKTGFEMPIYKWLRADLREWGESLLEKRAIDDSGVFDYEVVQKFWKEHQEGRARHEYRLWNVLMYQAWHRENARS